jgi:hypothetical protein
LNKNIDEIRDEIKGLIKLRESFSPKSLKWKIVQTHLNTLLWVIGAIDTPVGQMLENYLEKIS